MELNNPKVQTHLGIESLEITIPIPKFEGYKFLRVDTKCGKDEYYYPVYKEFCSKQHSFVMAPSAEYPNVLVHPGFIYKKVQEFKVAPELQPRYSLDKLKELPTYSQGLIRKKFSGIWVDFTTVTNSICIRNEDSNSVDQILQTDTFAEFVVTHLGK